VEKFRISAIKQSKISFDIESENIEEAKRLVSSIKVNSLDYIEQYIQIQVKSISKIATNTTNNESDN
jgi:hypothetical protein